MRPSSALRAAAWGVVVVGVAVPLARRRLRIPPPLVTASAAAAPVALSVAVRRSRSRDVAVCALQMWAYIATYQMPHDDAEALERRVHVDYPVAVDRVIGLGQLPTLRLQRGLAKDGELRMADQALAWVHWVWFFIPHGTVAYLIARHRDHFPAGAARIYGVFDLGVIVYWVLPTAPPWYAAKHGRIVGAEGEAAMRRIMVEHGEAFWKERWQPLYSFLGGNPLAAMPSLHFATSLMAARVLAEVGPVQGAVGWTYALTLGFALVYLGEHYVIDLLAGASVVPGRPATGSRGTRMTEDRAPVQDVNVSAGQHDDDEEMPKMGITRERALIFGLFVISAIAFLYVILPQLGDVKETWGRLDEGDPYWLAVAFGFQLAATFSYIAIFQDVHVPPGYPITYRESYQIMMASLAATRLFAAGGAGGVALTAWALRRSGMPRRDVAERMIAFLVLIYGVYMVALIVFGLGLRWGIFPGAAPYGVTVVPAYIALIAILVFLALAFLPANLGKRLSKSKKPKSKAGRLGRQLASGPERLGGGTRFAISKLRHPDWALMGTLGWWGFNVAILWASFKAFGEAPPLAVCAQAYFVGLLANLLPLPGGIGGVDAGMVGALLAFNVDPGLAVVAVLVYRGFAFWLPTLPGAVAYLQLRRTVARWKEERAAGRRPETPAHVTI